MQEIVISSSRKQECIDITAEVKQAVKNSEVKDGICLVYATHATAAVMINENDDPNIGDDFLDALNKLIPAGIWRHDSIDNNGDAHIKAAIVGPSETIPVKDGKLVMGRWQDIFLVDFDGPRSGRRAIVECIGK